MDTTIKKLPVFQIFKDAFNDFNKDQSRWRIFWLLNFVFCAVFNMLPKGFANPLSLVWSFGFYVFWCTFFRFYYQKKPYFHLQKVFASAVPSSKMIFITFALTMFLLLVPFIPLMMGFKGQYLIFFERYMSAIQSGQTSLLNMTIFSVIFLFLSPVAFCRPYLAFIAAVQGLNGSLRKTFKKTQNNYFAFLSLMFFLNLPCFIAYQADILLNCHGWFSVGFYSVYLIYFNLVFAKVYDWFNV